MHPIPLFNEFHRHAMLNYPDCFHFQWLQSYVRGLQEEGAASPARAEHGRSGQRLCPAEGWWTSSLTPTQSLILLNEEERSQSNGSLFILFISLTLLPWVFGCECVDRAVLEIETGGDEIETETMKFHIKISNTLDCARCSFRCDVWFFVEVFIRHTSFIACQGDNEKEKMLPWPLRLCWETKEGSLPPLRGLKSQGQRSLSKLRRGLALKTSGPVGIHTHCTYIHTLTVLQGRRGNGCRGVEKKRSGAFYLHSFFLQGPDGVRDGQQFRGRNRVEAGIRIAHGCLGPLRGDFRSLPLLQSVLHQKQNISTFLKPSPRFHVCF